MQRNFVPLILYDNKHTECDSVLSFLSIHASLTLNQISLTQSEALLVLSQVLKSESTSKGRIHAHKIKQTNPKQEVAESLATAKAISFGVAAGSTLKIKPSSSIHYRRWRHFKPDKAHAHLYVCIFWPCVRSPMYTYACVPSRWHEGG